MNAKFDILESHISAISLNVQTLRRMVLSRSKTCCSLRKSRIRGNKRRISDPDGCLISLKMFKSVTLINHAQIRSLMVLHLQHHYLATITLAWVLNPLEIGGRSLGGQISLLLLWRKVRCLIEILMLKLIREYISTGRSQYGCKRFVLVPGMWSVWPTSSDKSIRSSFLGLWNFISRLLNGPALCTY